MKFLQNPKVQQSSLDQRKAFLQKKGTHETSLHVYGTCGFIQKFFLSYPLNKADVWLSVYVSLNNLSHEALLDFYVHAIFLFIHMYKVAQMLLSYSNCIETRLIYAIVQYLFTLTKFLQLGMW